MFGMADAQGCGRTYGTVWRGLCLGAVAVGLLCAWTLDDSPRPKAAATPGRCAPPRSLKSGAAKKYRSNCMLCALVGQKAIASTYGLTGTSPAVLAARYARKTAPPAYRDAVAAGCLHGLQLGDSAAAEAPAASAPEASRPRPESTPGNGNAGGNPAGNGNAGGSGAGKGNSDAAPSEQGSSNGKGNAGGR